MCVLTDAALSTLRKAQQEIQNQTAALQQLEATRHAEAQAFEIAREVNEVRWVFHMWSACISPRSLQVCMCVGLIARWT